MELPSQKQQNCPSNEARTYRDRKDHPCRHEPKGCPDISTTLFPGVATNTRVRKQPAGRSDVNGRTQEEQPRQTRVWRASRLRSENDTHRERSTRENDRRPEPQCGRSLTHSRAGLFVPRRFRPPAALAGHPPPHPPAAPTEGTTCRNATNRVAPITKMRSASASARRPLRLARGAASSGRHAALRGRRSLMPRTLHRQPIYRQP